MNSPCGKRGMVGTISTVKKEVEVGSPVGRRAVMDVVQCYVLCLSRRVPCKRKEKRSHVVK